jgi:AraC-like DNA-binding protein
VSATALLAMRVPLGYKPQQEPEKPRYGGKRLSEPDRSRFLAALTASMEQEYAYRDGELTLNSLAARLAMTGHELSQLINDACGVNFQDYLNRYRVEEIKSALRGGEQAEDGVLELALAAGFNSKSAFNRAFKKHTGVTPSEFRRTKHG